MAESEHGKAHSSCPALKAQLDARRVRKQRQKRASGPASRAKQQANNRLLPSFLPSFHSLVNHLYSSLAFGNPPNSLY